MRNKLMQNGYILSDISFGAPSELLIEMYQGERMDQHLSTITSGSSETLPSQPYASRKKLGLHVEGLGEPPFLGSILGIQLAVVESPIEGGETLIAPAHDIFSELPSEYHSLSFTFYFEGRMTRYPLVTQHPIFGTPAFLYMDIERISPDSPYIEFDMNDQEIKETIHHILSRVTQKVSIPYGKYLYLDNFLCLHGRNAFLGNRKVQRHCFTFPVYE